MHQNMQQEHYVWMSERIGYVRFWFEARFSRSTFVLLILHSYGGWQLLLQNHQDSTGTSTAMSVLLVR